MLTSDASASEGLNLAPSPIPLAINFITLLILIYPVKRWLLEPLASVLAEREARTSGSDDRSSELLSNADAIAEQIETRLRDARIASQRARSEILATAQANERQILEAAREDAVRQVSEIREILGRELASARNQLASQGASLADLAASQILGRAI